MGVPIVVWSDFGSLIIPIALQTVTFDEWKASYSYQITHPIKWKWALNHWNTQECLEGYVHSIGASDAFLQALNSDSS